MDLVDISLLALLSFGLGAIPFSILVGRLFLRRDIRQYGDGNPGSANVFRAGGRRIGFLAVFLDIAKGFPAVYLAHAHFNAGPPALIGIGLAAILGHAFSPLLGWRGGKAIAVTFGVLLGMPDFRIVAVFAFFIVIGALFIDVDAWGIILGTSAATIFNFITRGSSWETFLMAGILIILAVKHWPALHETPGLRGRFVRWLQSVFHTANPT